MSVHKILLEATFRKGLGVIYSCRLRTRWLRMHRSNIGYGQPCHDLAAKMDSAVFAVSAVVTRNYRRSPEIRYPNPITPINISAPA